MISIDVMPFVAPTSVATTMAVMRPGRANGLGPARLPRRRRVLLMAFMSERGADHVTRQLCTEFNSKVGPGDRYKGWRNAARDYRKETALLSASPKPRRRVKGRKRRSAK
jgi:hypothetical protein